MNKNNLTIVSAFYNNANCIDKFLDSIDEVHHKLNMEQDFGILDLVLVNDGSEKSDYEILKKKIITKKFKIKLISHLKNYGQHQSIISGLKNAAGDYVVIINFDMDENPKYIVELFNKIKTDQETQSIVCVNDFKYNSLKSIFSSIFWKFYNLTFIGNKSKFQKKPRTLRIMKRNIALGIVKKSRKNIFFEGLFRDTVDLDYIKYYDINVKLSDTKYSFMKRLKLSLYAFYNKGHFFFYLYLTIFSIIGFFSLLLSIKYLIQFLFTTSTTPGFPSIIISLWFLGSVITAGISIIIYILLDLKNERQNTDEIKIKVDEN